jgi:hypothetical protein
VKARVKKKAKHPRVSLKSLLRRVFPKNRHRAVDWGLPVGRETL